MPEIYSMQRPGSPLRTFVACLLVLAASVSLAWYVAHRKATRDLTPLADLVRYPEGALSFQPPRGWEAMPPEDPPEGLIASFVEDAEAQGSTCRLYVFRTEPKPWAMPAGVAPEMITRMAGMLSPGVPRDVKSLGPAPIGGLPGWSVALTMVSPFRPTVQSHCLGRAAVAPAGQAAGVLLVSDFPPRRREWRLLDRVCQTLVLEDARTARTPPGELMAAAGIRFVAPPEVHFIECDAGRDYMLRLFAHDQTASWFLDLHRIPLLEGRSIASLTADLASPYARRSLAPPEAELSEENGRSFAHVWVESSLPEAAPVLLCAVQIDPTTALTMAGRCSHDGKPELLERCRSLARIAEVQNIGGLIDVPEAREAARRWLAGLRADGLARRMNAARCGEQRFVLRSPGMIIGTKEAICRPTDEVPPSWLMRSRLERKAGRGARLRSIETVRLSDDVQQHDIAARIEVAGLEVLRYQEERPSAAGPIHRRLQIGGRSREIESPIDEIYASEPVILLAASEMAADPAAGPMAFTSLSSHVSGPVVWFLLPWGERPLPCDRSGRTCRTVRVIRDYNPAAFTLQFDAEGQLEAVSMDDGTWQEPAERPAADPPGENREEPDRSPAEPAPTGPEPRAGATDETI